MLYVPDFKFSLLLVSKITNELCCSVSFYPEFCIFKGLYNGKVIGIDREHEELYWLQDIEKIKARTTIKDKSNSVLWHNRLGHPSMEILNNIDDLKVKMCKTQQELCIVCPMAKQSRSKSPIKTSITTSFFHLLHVDV